MLRHAQRHVEESVRVWIEAQLTTCGWIGGLSAPFGAGTTRVSLVAVDTAGRIVDGTTAAGTVDPLVVVQLTGQDADEEIEVGGDSAEVHYDLAVTVLALPSLAVALTEDIVDLLAGRSARPIPPHVDWSTQQPVAGELLEVVEVSSGRAMPDRGDWLLIQASVVRTFTRAWA